MTRASGGYAAPNDESCVHEQIVPYLDGELSDPEESAVREHVAICSSCRDSLLRHEELLRHLETHFQRERAASAAPVSDDFLAEVRRRAAPPRWRFARPLAAAAAVALVSLLVWALSAGPEQPGPDLVTPNPTAEADGEPVAPRRGSENGARVASGSAATPSGARAEDLDSDLSEDDEELLAQLEVLVAFEEEGVDLTPELVQVLLEDDSGATDSGLDQIFEYLLEEELMSAEL